MKPIFERDVNYIRKGKEKIITFYSVEHPKKLFLSSIYRYKTREKALEKFKELKQKHPNKKYKLIVERIPKKEFGSHPF